MQRWGQLGGSGGGGTLGLRLGQDRSLDPEAGRSRKPQRCWEELAWGPTPAPPYGLGSPHLQTAIGGRMKRGQQRMGWLHGITDSQPHYPDRHDHEATAHIAQLCQNRSYQKESPEWAGVQERPRSKQIPKGKGGAQMKGKRRGSRG